VELADGGKATASTETLALSDGSAPLAGMLRSWVFPKGCPIWVHARVQRQLGEDDIMSETLPNNEDFFRFTVYVDGVPLLY